MSPGEELDAFLDWRNPQIYLLYSDLIHEPSANKQLKWILFKRTLFSNLDALLNIPNILNVIRYIK